LGEKSLQALGMSAMDSYCERFEPSRYLDAEEGEALAVCHGAAGILLLADAFALHAGHEGSDALAQRLERLVFERVASIRRLIQRDLSLLTGASGVLGALLVRRGCPRGWLILLGLR
jgi:hypothetical protein